MIFQFRVGKRLQGVMFSHESFVACLKRKDSVSVEIYKEIKKQKAKDTRICIGSVTYKNLNDYQELIYVEIVPQDKLKEILESLRATNFSKM